MATPTFNILDGGGTARAMAFLQDATSNFLPSSTVDNAQATYRAAANFTPQATAAVTMITITGSASKTIRIKRIGISGVSTGSGQQILALQRTSALGAGGTLVAPTVAKLDTNSAAASAVVNHWTTTLKAAGTPVGGPMNAQNIQTVVTAVPITSPGPTQFMFPENGIPTGQSIVLRGVADILEVQNIGAANLAAGTVLAYFVEWVEDAS